MAFASSSDERHLPPAFLKGSPGSVGRFNPGSFPIIAFALGLGECNIFYASFKKGESLKGNLKESENINNC